MTEIYTKLKLKTESGSRYLKNKKLYDRTELMNISQPLVSVVITTYNRPQKVRRAINSVINQMYKNYEIIVIEDGSTGGVDEWIDDQGFDKIT